MNTEDKNWKILKIALASIAVVYATGSLVHYVQPIVTTQNVVVTDVSTSHNKPTHKRYYINGMQIPESGTCSHDEKMTHLNALQGQTVQVIMNTSVFNELLEVNNLKTGQSISLCP